MYIVPHASAASSPEDATAAKSERYLAVQHHKARAVAAARWGNEAAEADARRDLAMAKIEQYAAKVVAEAPPLTDEQRDRLAGLLGGAA